MGVATRLNRLLTFKADKGFTVTKSLPKLIIWASIREMNLIEMFQQTKFRIAFQ